MCDRSSSWCKTHMYIILLAATVYLGVSSNCSNTWPQPWDCWTFRFLSIFARSQQSKTKEIISVDQMNGWWSYSQWSQFTQVILDNPVKVFFAGQPVTGEELFCLSQVRNRSKGIQLHLEIWNPNLWIRILMHRPSACECVGSKEDEVPQGGDDRQGGGVFNSSLFRMEELCIYLQSFTFWVGRIFWEGSSKVRL